MDADFFAVWDEVELLKDYYDNQKMEQIVCERACQTVDKIGRMEFECERFGEYPAWLLAEVFDFADMDYYAGMKLFDKVLEGLGVKMSQDKRFELYDAIYDEVHKRA